MQMETREQFAGAIPQGRSTGELLRVLADTDNLEEALQDMEPDFQEKSFSERIHALMELRGLKTARLAEASMMSRTFVYQIVGGTRVPSRNAVLQLALLLQAGPDETQRLLRSAGRGSLYPRIRRDAILLYALRENMELQATEDLLVRSGELPLSREP